MLSLISLVVATLAWIPRGTVPSEEVPPVAAFEDRVQVTLIAVDEDDVPIPHASITASRVTPLGQAEVTRRRADADGAVVLELVDGARYMVLAGRRVEGGKVPWTELFVDGEGAPQELRVVLRSKDDLVRPVQLRALDSVELIRAVCVGDEEPYDRRPQSKEERFLPIEDGIIDLPAASWRSKHYWIEADGYQPLFLELGPDGWLPSELRRGADDRGENPGVPEFYLRRASRLVVKGVDAKTTQAVRLELEARDFAPGTERHSDSAAAMAAIGRMPAMTVLGDSGGTSWHFEGLPDAARISIVLCEGRRVLRRERLTTGGPGTTINYTVDMSTICAITGTSLAESGEPKVGQRVRLGSSQSLGDGYSSWKHRLSYEWHLMEVLTDEAGRFAFESLAPGEYCVWTVAEGADWQPDTFRSFGHPVDDPTQQGRPSKPRVIFPDLVTDVGFERPRAELVLQEYEGSYLHGTLRSETGQPTTGQVAARGPGGEWIATSRAAFHHGAFRLGPVRKGEYALYAVRATEDRASPVGVYAPGPEPLDLKLPNLDSASTVAAPAWRLGGAVQMGQSGSDVPKGTIIRVTPYDDDGLGGAQRGILRPELPRSHEHAVGKDGQFDFKLLPHARFLVGARAPGMSRAIAVVYAGKPGQRGEDLNLTLRPAVEIEVTIKGHLPAHRVTAKCNVGYFFDPPEPLYGDSYLYPRQTDLPIIELPDRPGVFRIEGAPFGALVKVAVLGPGARFLGRKSFHATPLPDGSALHVTVVVAE